MKTSKLNIQLVTGIFVVIGILCFTYAAINIGGVRFTDRPSYTLHARFTSISGLQEGAIVEAAGVEEGVAVGQQTGGGEGADLFDPLRRRGDSEPLTGSHDVTTDNEP